METPALATDEDLLLAVPEHLGLPEGPAFGAPEGAEDLARVGIDDLDDPGVVGARRVAEEGGLAVVALATDQRELAKARLVEAAAVTPIDLDPLVQEKLSVVPWLTNTSTSAWLPA